MAFDQHREQIAFDALDTARVRWAGAGSAPPIGSAFGGMDLYEAEQIKSAKRKSLAASPYLVPGLLINQMAGQVARPGSPSPGRPSAAPRYAVSD